MKKCLATLAILITSTSFVFAQDVEDKKPETQIQKASHDFVMLQLTYENWSKTPDSVKTGGLGRGFNAYLCYDFPIKKSNFSFAIERHRHTRRPGALYQRNQRL
jgi:hypothetical protein